MIRRGARMTRSTHDELLQAEISTSMLTLAGIYDSLQAERNAMNDIANGMAPVTDTASLLSIQLGLAQFALKMELISKALSDAEHAINTLLTAQ